jgi:hypothetical protein
MRQKWACGTWLTVRQKICLSSACRRLMTKLNIVSARHRPWVFTFHPQAWIVSGACAWLRSLLRRNLISDGETNDHMAGHLWRAVAFVNTRSLKKFAYDTRRELEQSSSYTGPSYVIIMTQSCECSFFTTNYDINFSRRPSFLTNHLCKLTNALYSSCTRKC